MKLIISIIICTHNPRIHYLKTVINALKKQTLPTEYWELLLIDNASDCSLDSKIDMNWHSNNRYIREEQLGLVHARIRGIQESKADVLIFVDDDNVLYPDYLEVALKISREYPLLGVWGGQTIGEFEEPPPEWTKPYWIFLGIREFEQDTISNPPDSPVHVIGAGACYRKATAQAYIELATKDFLRKMLGRQGSSLLSREDIDMCYTAYDIGLGSAIFTSLKLKHLIPPNRLSEDYLIRLVSRDKYSELLLLYIRGKIAKLKMWKHLLRLILLPIPWLVELKAWTMSPRSRKFCFAERRASLEAMIKIFELQNLIRQGQLTANIK